uniref:Putative zinc finger BED domain-containing protein RICESLEEPER 2-like n=1 Tax=Davidia involucrata TaxID=16924 RepID=A0A5B7BBC5_DAVIN
MAIAAVLDPRYKMRLIEFCFPKIYSSIEAELHINIVRDSLYELYNDYVVIHSLSYIGPKNSQVGSSSTGSNVTSGNTRKTKTRTRSEFDTWAKDLDTIQPTKSDLDVYLEAHYTCNDDSDA